MSGATQRPPLTATINVPMTTRVVAVNHEQQSVTIEVRAGRYAWLHTYTVTESP